MYQKHPYYSNYKANKNGSVIGAQGKLLTPINHHTGYDVITVRNNGKEQKQYRLHRFIWECFNGIITDDRVINHINGNKKDNNIDNLELVSNKTNVIHAYKIGLKKGNKGTINSNSKLTEKQARTLIGYLITTDKPNKWYGDLFGLHPNYVSLIKHKKRWNHIWEEIEGSTTIRKEYTQVSGSWAQFTN